MNRSSIWVGNVHTTRLGQVWVALSSRGLVAVEFGVTRDAFEKNVRKQTRGRIEIAPERVTEAARQIKEYVDGKRRTFDIKIDWSVLSSDFQRSALQVVHSIPYGQTLTYAQVAAKIGHPDAPRAVGRANATNPMPLVIPCHRVIGTDGKLHGYGGVGGLKTKQWLLDLERTG